jgi:hypothetical protein
MPKRYIASPFHVVADDGLAGKVVEVETTWGGGYVRYVVFQGDDVLCQGSVRGTQDEAVEAARLHAGEVLTRREDEQWWVRYFQNGRRSVQGAMRRPDYRPPPCP